MDTEADTEADIEVDIEVDTQRQDTQRQDNPLAGTKSAAEQLLLPQSLELLEF